MKERLLVPPVLSSSGEEDRSMEPRANRRRADPSVAVPEDADRAGRR